MNYHEYLAPVFWKLKDANERDDRDTVLYMRGFLMGAVTLLGINQEISVDEQMRMIAEIFSE